MTAGHEADLRERGGQQADERRDREGGARSVGRGGAAPDHQDRHREMPEHEHRPEAQEAHDDRRPARRQFVGIAPIVDESEEDDRGRENRHAGRGLERHRRQAAPAVRGLESDDVAGERGAAEGGGDRSERRGGLPSPARDGDERGAEQHDAQRGLRRHPARVRRSGRQVVGGEQLVDAEIDAEQVLADGRRADERGDQGEQTRRRMEDRAPPLDESHRESAQRERESGVELLGRDALLELQERGQSERPGGHHDETEEQVQAARNERCAPDDGRGQLCRCARGLATDNTGQATRRRALVCRRPRVRSWPAKSLERLR